MKKQQKYFKAEAAKQTFLVGQSNLDNLPSKTRQL